MMVFIPPEIISVIVGCNIKEYHAVHRSANSGITPINRRQLEVYLSMRQDLCSFCLVSRTFAHFARDYLYVSVALWELATRGESFLQALQSNPALAPLCTTITFNDLPDPTYAKDFELPFDILGLLPNLKSLFLATNSGYDSTILSMEDVTMLCDRHKRKWPNSFKRLKHLNISYSAAPILALLICIVVAKLESIVLDGYYQNILPVIDSSYRPIQVRDLILQKNTTPMHFRGDAPLLHSLLSPDCILLHTYSGNVFGELSTIYVQDGFQNLKKVILVTINEPDEDTIMNYCDFLKRSKVEHVEIQEETPDTLTNQPRKDTDTIIATFLQHALPPLLSKLTIHRYGDKYTRSIGSHSGLQRIGLIHHTMVQHDSDEIDAILTIEEWTKKF